ncbi:prepilin peptidase [Lichenicoccus sp.]|uniref:prepilin peptidase n=1 Tax=Lichenicoccus sp. TaxID=2781899 RepID=UPI003D1264B4
MDAAGVLALVASPFAGSFLGVVVRRLPQGRDWAWSRSACETCGRTLRPAELVPLLSFALLRGRCAGCGGAIGWFHPAIELAAVAVTVLVIVAVGTQPAVLLAGCVLGWVCLALALIDWRHQRLPDALTLPLLLLGLLVTAWLQSRHLFDHALACVLGWLAFRAIALLYRRLRGIEGLGAGDAKLLAAAGAWLGVAALPRVVELAAGLTLLGVLGSALWTWRWLAPSRRVAFGPGLAASLFACWLTQGF